MRILAKVLQAVGIAEVMIGLATGLMGDMWKELYFSVAGILVFTAGWLIQRRVEKKAASG